MDDSFFAWVVGFIIAAVINLALLAAAVWVVIKVLQATGVLA